MASTMRNHMRFCLRLARRNSAVVSPSSCLYIYKEHPKKCFMLRDLRRHISTSSKLCFAQVEHNQNETTASEKHEFQAETKMLLDIVAKSLYSEKEVFIRELISNANDALEKLRYMSLTSQELANKNPNLEINISTDKVTRTLTIQDSGIGMTKEELIQNIGTIARSGSKAFIQEIQKNNETAANIIGQFGVGFYSCFMVADKVEVFTRSSSKSSKGLHWVSDGTGTYEISDHDDVIDGTKIVIHLKDDCKEFSNEDVIKDVIKKYSNFVGNPIKLNNQKVNNIQALWTMDPKDVTPIMHEEFYRFIANSYDRPRFYLHFSTDAPINIRCLIYFPEGRPGLFEMSRETEMGVALYSKKILIKNKADNILPKWLRFVKGVVDSEEIPLNLSRELLQDSALIRRLRTVLTNRIVRFLIDKMRKDPNLYDQFYQDYNIFLKEGIIASPEQMEKDEISKLLRYESSQRPEGEKITLPEYCSRLKDGQTEIYYLAAPSRQLAETSPYFEAMKERDVEVLFCYENYDELVLLQLRQFDRKNIVSVEKEMRRDKEEVKSEQTEKEMDSLMDWLKKILDHKVHQVKITNKLSNHPCVVTVEEMGAARHFVRTQFQNVPDEQRYKILQPTFEINPNHLLVKKLNSLRTTDLKLAELLAHQLFDNSMALAGLQEDIRPSVNRLNELLSLVFADKESKS